MILSRGQKEDRANFIRKTNFGLFSFGTDLILLAQRLQDIDSDEKSEQTELAEHAAVQTSQFAGHDDKRSKIFQICVRLNKPISHHTYGSIHHCFISKLISKPVLIYEGYTPKKEANVLSLNKI